MKLGVLKRIGDEVTSRMEKIKILSDMLGGDIGLVLRMEKAAEAKMIEERAVEKAVKEAVRATYKGSDGPDKTGEDAIVRLMAKLRAEDPETYDIVKRLMLRWGLEDPKAPQISDADLVKGGRNLTMPVGDRQSVQKELRAADPISAFMAGVGMNLSGKVSKKERKARDPISAMLTGVRWRQ